MKFLIIALCLVQLSWAHWRPPIRRAQFDVVKSIINDMLDNNTNSENVKFLIPGSVRLVFHDCIGGCNGCINKDQKGNEGLEQIINAMERYYKKEEVITYLSRADFWTLTSVIAINKGVDINNEWCKSHPEVEDCENPKVNMHWLSGRFDCNQSPFSSGNDDLPDSNMDSPAFNAWWRKTFNLSPNNGVSLMGLHTLGKATGEYVGKWDAQLQDGVNNRYFINIEDKCKEWVQVPSDPNDPNSKLQWVGRNNSFGTNADMAPFLNFRIDPKTNPRGNVSCNYKTCGHTRGTAGMLSRYARDSQNWVNNLRHTFRHLIEAGTRLYWVR